MNNEILFRVICKTLVNYANRKQKANKNLHFKLSRPLSHSMNIYICTETVGVEDSVHWFNL